MAAPTVPAAPPLPPQVLDAGGSLSSSEFGLAMGYVVCKHFFGMDDLHYGYWPKDLPVTPQNLARAQAHYTDLILSKIPKGVKSILDVGMGAGTTAVKLVAAGYKVDGVSPNGVLTEVAKQKLAGRATIFETKFQDLETDRRYDLILFSESLLFIPLEAAFAQAMKLLHPGGYILITDIFKVPAEGKSPIGGGHELAKFRAAVAAVPLDQVEDVDVTDGIAPTFDVLDRAYKQALEPAYRLFLARMTALHPWILRVVRWTFRKTFDKIEHKHFSGRRNGANFKQYKSYRLLLFKRR